MGVLLTRCFDADRINALANHPAIRPGVGGEPDAPLDLSALVADGNHYFLTGEHGGFAYVWTAPRVYEVHTFIVPAGRGGWAARAATESLSVMRPAADMVWTRVAPDAPHVAAFARRAGFQSIGTLVSDLGKGPVPYTLMEWRP
jgi:hypothetical protein